MTRFFAILIALMLLALPALAETAPADPFDYVEDVLQDGTLVYSFQDLSLRLPADWGEKVLVLRDEGGVSFYQKASYEKYQEEGIEGGGFLFSLAASVNTDYRDILPSYEELGFSEPAAMHYYLVTPSDYPAWIGDEDIRAEWDGMYAQIAEYIVPNAELYE